MRKGDGQRTVSVTRRLRRSCGFDDETTTSHCGRAPPPRPAGGRRAQLQTSRAIEAARDDEGATLRALAQHAARQEAAQRSQSQAAAQLTAQQTVAQIVAAQQAAQLLAQAPRAARPARDDHDGGGGGGGLGGGERAGAAEEAPVVAEACAEASAAEVVVSVVGGCASPRAARRVRHEL